MIALPKEPLLREAFRRRALGMVERMASEAPAEVLADALAAPTDAGALARALTSAATADAVRALDPFAAAIARGVEAREALVRKAGGLLSAAEVARMLGITRQAVDKRRGGGKLLAVKVGGDWRYPAAQFGPGGATPAGLEEVIASDSPWGALSFLVSEDTVLEGRTPLQILRDGGIDIIRRMLAQRETDVYG